MMSDTEAANIGWLPIDFVREIALRLPVKSLLRFKAVSKWWQSLISDSSFIEQHLAIANNSQRRKLALFISSRDNIKDNYVRVVSYMINYDDDVPFSVENTIEHDLKVIGTSSYVKYFSYWGGIFMIGTDEGGFSLWNPATKEKKKIPQSPCFEINKNAAKPRCAALGYDFSTNSLKVVMVWRGREPNSTIKQTFVEVYDVRTNCWTNATLIKDDAKPTTKFYPFANCTTLANGWVCWGSPRKIACFDAGMNKLMELLPLPEGARKCYEIYDMEGGLGVRIRTKTNQIIDGKSSVSRRVEIWTMKESWTKLMDIINKNNAQFPICFAKNGEVLVSSKYNENLNVSLFFRNMRDSFEIPYEGRWFYIRSVSYVESLVSLYAQDHEIEHDDEFHIITTTTS